MEVNICVAIMIKEALPGSVKTRMCPPMTARQAADLARHMFVDCLELVRQVGLAHRVFVDGHLDPTVVGVPKDHILGQVGDTFGDRLANAQRAVFDLGFGGCIILPGDCPTVSRKMLREVSACLEEGNMILAPSLDGGYLLLGSASACPTLFTSVVMGTDRVASETLREASRLGLSTRLLETRTDLDTIADLRLADNEGWLDEAKCTKDFMSAWTGLCPEDRV